MRIFVVILPYVSDPDKTRAEGYRDLSGRVIFPENLCMVITRITTRRNQDEFLLFQKKKRVFNYYETLMVSNVVITVPFESYIVNLYESEFSFTEKTT